MKTIKIIDLFVKIANGEEVPKKIKIGGYTFEFYTSQFSIKDTYNCINSRDTYLTSFNLNREVEIIEEDKEIEEALGIILLGQCDNWLQKRDVNIKSDFELNPYILEAITDNFKSLYYKQCELVKVVNELKKGE